MLAKVVITILAFIGLFLMFVAIKGKRIHAATKRIKISLVPAHPSLGYPLLVKLSFTSELIASATANTELALICYATDRQSSSSSPREIWAQRITTSVRPELNRMRLEHTFDIPKDLPVSGHDSSRSDDIRWVVELLNLNHGKRLSWVVQVRAPSSMSQQMLNSISQQHSNTGGDAFDSVDMGAQSKLRDFSNLQQWLEQPDTVEPLIQLPTKVFRAVTTETGNMLVFPRRGWRMAALLIVALAGWLSYTARQEFTNSGTASTLWGVCYMLAALITALLALHWSSLRWIVTTQTNGVAIDRSSWLRKRVYNIERAALQRVQLKYVYAQSEGTGLVKNFSLRVQSSSEKKEWIALTPSIAHESIAKHAMAHIWSMQRDAHTRFSIPLNVQTLSTANGPRSLVIIFILAIAIGIFAFASSGMVSRKMWPSSFFAVDSMQRGWQMRLGEFTSTGRLNQRLFDAQSNSDIAALRAALKDGADPNATAPEGYTVLMFASRRGQPDIVDALIQAGADIERRDEISTTNGGDTALLAAAFGGNPAVIERLLQANANTNATNMWDWNAVHMAAQRDCADCLELLHARQLPLNNKAVSSRGETPLMLAAARGRIAAMQWLIDHGADLRERNPHGQDALAWARFGKSAVAIEWIEARLKTAK